MKATLSNGVSGKMGVSESIQMSAMQHQESGYLLELIYQTAEGYIVYDRFFAVWLKRL